MIFLTGSGGARSGRWDKGVLIHWSFWPTVPIRRIGKLFPVASIFGICRTPVFLYKRPTFTNSRDSQPII